MKTLINYYQVAINVIEWLLRSFLASDKKYGDFHLRARVKIGTDGDSGIYFRCEPDRTHPRGVLRSVPLICFKFAAVRCF